MENDYLDATNGIPATSSNVIVVSVSGGAGTFPIDSNVFFNCALPPGIYTFQYQICEIANPANCSSVINGSVTTIGTYTTSVFGLEFSVTPGTITGINNTTVNTVQFVVSQIGAIGGYIDVTFNGTYNDTSGTHTISGTAHVIRDN